MAGIIKDGQVYATKVDIDDNVISKTKTWSSDKISKINVTEAKKVDSKPTYADGTITYVKDGTSYTTTNDKQWFYYLDNDSVKQTIFIDGEELTIYSASVDFSEYIKKDSILSVIQDTDNSKIFGAKAVYDTFNQKCDKINLYELKDSTNNNKTKHMIIDIPASHSISGKTTRVFFTDNISSIGLQIWNGATLEKDYRTPLINPNHIYIAPKTLTPVNSKVNFTNIDSSCNYTVINGKCYVNIWSMNITGDLSVETIFSNLPTAKASSQFVLSNDVGSKIVGMGWIGIGTQIIQCNAKLETGSTKSQGYTRFSYPIDESWIPS